jgi:hypothetical protein
MTTKRVDSFDHILGGILCDLGGAVCNIVVVEESQWHDP